MHGVLSVNFVKCIPRYAQTWCLLIGEFQCSLHPPFVGCINIYSYNSRRKDSNDISILIELSLSIPVFAFGFGLR